MVDEKRTSELLPWVVAIAALVGCALFLSFKQEEANRFSEALDQLKRRQDEFAAAENLLADHAAIEQLNAENIGRLWEAVRRLQRGRGHIRTNLPAANSKEPNDNSFGADPSDRSKENELRGSGEGWMDPNRSFLLLRAEDGVAAGESRALDQTDDGAEELIGIEFGSSGESGSFVDGFRMKREASREKRSVSGDRGRRSANTGGKGKKKADPSVKINVSNRSGKKTPPVDVQYVEGRMYRPCPDTALMNSNDTVKGKLPQLQQQMAFGPSENLAKIGGTRDSQDHVVVGEPGYYYIFAQVTFIHTIGRNAYDVVVEQAGGAGYRAATCTTSGSTSPKVLKNIEAATKNTTCDTHGSWVPEDSCHTGAMARLERGDKVYIAVSQYSKCISVDSGKTYFGLIKLASSSAGTAERVPFVEDASMACRFERKGGMNVGQR